MEFPSCSESQLLNRPFILETKRLMHPVSSQVLRFPFLFSLIKSLKSCPSEQSARAMPNHYFTFGKYAEDLYFSCVFLTQVQLWNPSCPRRKGWRIFLNEGLNTRKNKVTRYHNQPDSIRRSHARNLMLYSEQKEREGLDRKEEREGGSGSENKWLLWELVHKGRRLSGSGFSSQKTSVMVMTSWGKKSLRQELIIDFLWTCLFVE